MTSLLLAPELFVSDGGIPRILRLYLRALCDLAKPADRVRFVTLNDARVDGSGWPDLRNEALDRQVACDRSKLRFVQTTLRWARDCDRIICGHIGQLPIAFAARLVNPNLRYYLIAHGVEVWRPVSWLQRLALRRCAQVFCVSEYTRQELHRHCHLPAARTSVLPNGLDPTFPIARGEACDRNAPVILTVSRLRFVDRRKGVEHLIQAMPAVLAALPGAVLKIIGRGDDLPRLRTMSESLGVAGAVNFLGYVDDAIMTRELRSCSLFALPSEKEGFGLVFIEAMANGRPCLGARAGGIPEVITGETGMLADYGDVPALAAACLESLRRNWNEEEILARARQFSYPVFRDKLQSLLAA